MTLINNSTPRFADILEYHLNLKLQLFVHENLNKNSMIEMYHTIKTTVDEVFSRSSQNISEKARSWVAQQYYSNIKISNSALITEDESTWNHTVSKVFDAINIADIETSELRFIGGLFSDMVFAEDILKELRKR